MTTSNPAPMLQTTHSSGVKVSIVIVNWHTVDYLIRCLKTIRDQVKVTSIEVLVADNGSYDGSAATLGALFPDVRFMQFPQNLGFAKANNLASTHTRGEYILFLNPDTEFIDDCVSALAGCLDAKPDTGAAGCCVRNADGSLQGQYLQAWPTILNQVLGAQAIQATCRRSRLWGRRAMYDYTDLPLSVQVIAGSCLMLRRTVFEAVGRFTESYYMYGEDVDLCHKIAASGYELRYVGSVSVIHHGGAASAFRSESHFSTIMQMESLFHFFALRRSPAYARFYRMAIGSAALLRLVLLAIMRIGALDDSRSRQLLATQAKWRSVLRWSCRRHTERVADTP